MIFRFAAVLILFAFMVPEPAQAEQPTVVETRAPSLVGPKVLNKFFVKRKRLELDLPTIGYLTSNPFIDDMMVGLAASYHISDRVAIELHGAYGIYGFLAGGNNFKKIVGAVVNLVGESDFRLETVDPELQAGISVLWSPMYGKINPFGSAVINLDFYFFAGAGVLSEQIKMAKQDILLDDIGNRAFTDLEYWPNLGATGTLYNFMLNLGGGVKVFLTRGFSLRIDARLYLTFPKTLDYREGRDDNIRAETTLGRVPNRTDCGVANAPVSCVQSLNSTLVVSVAPSFWFPKAPPRQSATLIRR